MFRLDDDKENLWQVQADDDGNEFLVRTYELPKEDALQATSEWHVQTDGKKASLTVAYRGMPIHRLVAAEYGAHTPDDVKLLCDLVQAKLTNDDFAGRMLASLPELKRAALLETFPKLAANKPIIPSVSGKDPLEGIEPLDIKKEWYIDPKAKSDLPLPGEWAKHPQMAEDDKDPWCDRAFQADMGRPELREEAKTIVPQVMAYLKARSGEKVSLQTLYMELEVNDQSLYIALHALVKGGLIQGASPYDVPSAEMSALTGQSDTTHKDLFYSVGESIQHADTPEGKTKTLSMTVAPQGVRSFMISFLQDEMTKAFSEADTEEERYSLLDDFCTHFKDFIQKQRST
jgi:hypothetical protein